jgi:hypothetical protein
MKSQNVNHFSIRLAGNLAILAVLAAGLSASSGQSTGAGGAGAPAEKIEGYKDTPMLPGGKWHMHDPDRPQPAVVTPGAAFSQGAPPPSDAEMLFDGKDLSKWQSEKGGEAAWKVQDGYVEIVHNGGIRTRGKWADFQLHLEFAEPTPPTGHGQARGNSGVLIGNLYEVQIVDSYQDKTYADGQAGALYGQVPPLVNPAKPPGEWQTYDIIWNSPRWNEKGELTQKASVTVLFNGVVIQDKSEYIGSTDGIGGQGFRQAPVYKQHPPEVFIELQDHNGNKVRFRNIWVRDLHLGERSLGGLFFCRKRGGKGVRSGFVEISLARRVMVCRHDSCGRGDVSAQAQTGGEAGLQHAALAKIPRGCAGQRALPAPAPQLAADPPTAPAGAGGAGAEPPLLRRTHPGQRSARGDPGRLGLHAEHGRGAVAL